MSMVRLILYRPYLKTQRTIMPMDQGSLLFWNIDFKVTKWIYHLKERKWSNQERKKKHSKTLSDSFTSDPLPLFFDSLT